MELNGGLLKPKKRKKRWGEGVRGKKRWGERVKGLGSKNDLKVYLYHKRVTSLVQNAEFVDFDELNKVSFIKSNRKEMTKFLIELNLTFSFLISHNIYVQENIMK